MQHGLVIGRRFETLAHVARGGMGSIYRARDRETGRIVAVKVLTLTTPDAAARFQREAALLATIHHPNVVDYVSHGHVDGVHYLAQEWIEGANLAYRLRSAGVTTQEAVGIAIAMASALGAIHAQAMIHRDVKPANIIVPDAGVEQTKLVDFGIARLTTGVGALTRAGTAIGTPSYMAPEQARAVPSVDAAADVWALGCVLYEMLAARQAFGGASAIAIRAKVMLAELPPLTCPEAPVGLVTLVQDLIRKDPAARPRDGGEVLARLRALPPIAAGPRRPFGTSAPSTEALTGVVQVGSVRPSASAFVIVQPGEDTDLTIADQLTRIAGAHGLEAYVFDDGSAVLAATLPGKAGAIAAARAAIALRSQIIDGVVGVFGQPDPDTFEQCIDRGTVLVEKAAMAAAFAQPATLEVVVDDMVAALVEGEVPIVRGPGGLLIKVDAS